MKWIKIEDNARYMSIVGICLMEIGLIFLTKLYFSCFYNNTICYFFYNHKENILIYLMVAIIGFLLVLLPLLIHRKSFRFRRDTMTKLLASVIRSRTLHIIYLCLFILHISCLGSVTHSFLIEDNELLDGIVMIIITMGCAVLIITFPNPKRKEKNENKVFISGISKFSFKKEVIEEFQLYPIIREFFVIKSKIALKEGDKMHIILSKDINLNYIEQRISEIQTPKFLKSIKGYNSQESVDWFIQEISKIELNNDNFYKTITNFIKLHAKYTYYDNKEFLKLIDNLEITYSPPANYNNFKECFDITRTILEEYEKAGYDVIINSSPGTATLTSALTILSMASNRQLLYYSQDETIEIKDKMIEIMENKINFKEFIENVSEELSYPDD